MDDTAVTRTVEIPLSVLTSDSLAAGKSRILAEIGRPWERVVCETEDLELQRSVVRSSLARHLMDSPEFKQRFLIEPRAAAAPTR